MSAAATEVTPLINATDVDKDVETGEDKPLKMIDGDSLRVKAVTGAAIATVATSIGAMALEGNPVAYVSGAIGVGLAPYSALQERKIAEVKALKEVNEAMERELGQYKEQNERLHKTVGELEGSVKNLQELEQTLKEIKMMESSTLDELEVQLQEQKEIEDQLEDNLVAEICQNVISICLAVDKDGDMNLSDDEIALLIAKIQSIGGVAVDEEKFKALIIENGRSMTAVMEVLRNLLDDQLDQDQNIFTELQDSS
uniref:Uncharacterized protein n=1 Tax=Ditylum brightwellii TaxID=49249 RepID=A0A7S1ZD06_9STRA|mmetsp:Transcript_29406/g.43777  ORF Transcript_29406/g.43777 Transcript_29406/m.43777 type:complete len:255 (+) Transcript_29406:75-839(+)